MPPAEEDEQSATIIDKVVFKQMLFRQSVPSIPVKDMLQLVLRAGGKHRKLWSNFPSIRHDCLLPSSTAASDCENLPRSIHQPRPQLVRGLHDPGVFVAVWFGARTSSIEN